MDKVSSPPHTLQAKSSGYNQSRNRSEKPELIIEEAKLKLKFEEGLSKINDAYKQKHKIEEIPSGRKPSSDKKKSFIKKNIDEAGTFKRRLSSRN